MRHNKWREIAEITRRLESRGITLAAEEIAALRRCGMTLQRWGEMECGDSNEHSSWSIERDETTGKPYLVRNWYRTNETKRYPIADRERGALKRVAEICKRNGLSFYHQTDPRGCALYVYKEPLTDSVYSSGVAICG